MVCVSICAIKICRALGNSTGIADQGAGYVQIRSFPGRAAEASISVLGFRVSFAAFGTTQRHMLNLM